MNLTHSINLDRKQTTWYLVPGAFDVQRIPEHCDPQVRVLPRYTRKGAGMKDDKRVRLTETTHGAG